VKDRPTLDALVALSCPVAQGYHYSAPVAPPAFADWLQRHRVGA
jgi:EAL domain-containing protein (putative c-di-GMP-specific phosphodiesterase class I)